MTHSTKTLAVSVLTAVGLTAYATGSFKAPEQLEQQSIPTQIVEVLEQAACPTPNQSVEIPQNTAPESECVTSVEEGSVVFSNDEFEVSEEFIPYLKGAIISSFQELSFDQKAEPSKLVFELSMGNLDCRFLKEGMKKYRSILENEIDQEALPMVDAATKELFTKGKVGVDFVFNEQAFKSNKFVILPPTVEKQMKNVYENMKAEIGVGDLSVRIEASCRAQTFGLEA